MAEKKQDDRNLPPFPKSITGGGIVLALTPDEIYFETVGALPEDELDALMRRHKLRLASHALALRTASFNTAFRDRRWADIPKGETPESVIAELEADDRIRLASPVYHRPDLSFKTALSFADRVLAKLRVGVDSLRMTKSALKEGIRALAVTAEIEQPDGLLVCLSVPEPKKQSALDVAERASKLEEVKEAYPDWLSLTPAIAMTTPNDALFAKEWDMTQIFAPQGWELSRGAVSVVIAVVDTGCDLNHEDLAAKYVPVSDRFDAVTGSNTPNDDFGHGTCCAGLAAAATNNALGVAGVGWKCRIMPIKLMSHAHINSEFDIVSSINWARTHGANVVSMSWHWPGPTSNADVSFNAASAANLVLVAASGNDNLSSINWPAINPKIMAIGASDKIDHRKSPASPDGEGWGSDYGPEQSVIAPGVLCWAANNTNGGPSFNSNNGGPMNWAGVNYPSSGTADQKYFALMNGTSAATPHVAGLAGLLLAVNAALTNTQVRDIIEQTADKTGGYAYAIDAAHHNGTWHPEPGYGRINVLRALHVLFPQIATAIVSGGDFGNACVGSFVDELLTINNASGFASLRISNIISSSGDFTVPDVLSYPLVVSPGGSTVVVIRFRPTSIGPKSARITLVSNDPAGPHIIPVIGNAPSGKLTITGSSIFGGVPCGHRIQRIVSVCNTGECNLRVGHVGFKRKRRHFRLINNPFPATIRPGSSLDVVIQYKAIERAATSCELVIDSDDPDHPTTYLDVIAYTIWKCCNEPRKICCCRATRIACSEEHGDRCREEEGDDDET